MNLRVATVVFAAVGVGVTMVQLGMEPRPLLVALVMLVVGSTFFLVYDLGELAAPLAWHDHRGPRSAPARGDHRVQVLRLRLRQVDLVRRPSRGDDEPPVDDVGAALLAVIDDHLKATANIERRTDPEDAAAALPPELARFITDSGARRSMTRRRRLDATLTLIEDLVTDEDPALRGSSS